MPRRPPPPPAPTLQSAFDELRFGRERTLNLRASLPTGDEAARRAEAWLRERQMARAGEVLVVTGRGAGSVAGIAVVREAVARLLATLSRRGVVAAWQEHTAGSFVVRLAAVSRLYDSPKHAGPRPPAPRDPAALAALGAETRAALRRLAERSLSALGVDAPAEALIHDEMVARFAALAAALPPGAKGEPALRAAAERAILELDDG
jgi:hypothetical protein